MLSRRAFLGGAALGVGGLLCPAFASEEQTTGDPGKKSRVVLVNNPAVIHSGKIDSQIAEKLVHRAVSRLTGKDDPALAWKSLFSPKEKIAIKVNTRHPPVISNPEIVNAIVKGLKSAGVAENHVTIYDLTADELATAGYKLNESSKGVRCHSHRGYREMKAGPVPVWLSRILTDEVDAIINVPAFRHHVLAGITISMKNHLGSVRNPRALHRDNCLYVADLNALDPIRKKTRLILVDAIRGQYNLGPHHVPFCVWEYAGLMAATDTVAVDAVAAEEMKSQRRKKGISGAVRPTIRHVPRAAELGLGIADLKRISVVRQTA
jgi:uncharacterized protein (DUF362 family)